MKKILVTLMFALFSASILAAAPVKPLVPAKPSAQVLDNARAVYGLKLVPKGRHGHEKIWDRFGAPDPAWGYTIKVTTVSCPLIPGEECKVLATNFLGGSEDEGRCYGVRFDEINQYPNLQAAAHTVNFCEKQPQYKRWQKFIDPDGDNIYTYGPFIEYRFTIVKTQL